MFEATAGGEVVGLDFWYLQGDAADAYLPRSATVATRSMPRTQRNGSHSSTSPIGLRGDLGGAAGRGDDPSDGLAHFKRGWSTGTRPVYVCGRVLQSDVYCELSADDDGPAYFPRYRAGELASATIRSGSPSSSPRPAR